jgi:hypothetical protein
MKMIRVGYVYLTSRHGRLRRECSIYVHGGSLYVRLKTARRLIARAVKGNKPAGS